MEYKFVEFKLVGYEESTKYGRNQRNRAYNHAHLEKIKQQVKEYLDIMPPITINVVTNNIIDGQHRLKAFQSLVSKGELDPNSLIKVMFIEVPEDKEVCVIIDANTHSKNWTIDDYISSYINAGNSSYIRLKEWCLNHELACSKGKAKYRYGAAIITGENCSIKLKIGEFKAFDEDFEIADEIHFELVQIIDVFGMSYGSWIEGLAIAWYMYRNFHTFKVWLAELIKYHAAYPYERPNTMSFWKYIFNEIHKSLKESDT